MGACPGWYLLLRAADRLHSPPWELLDPDDTAPRTLWVELANGATGAENHARSMAALRRR